MADSICTRCFHNYVCEQFSEGRDYKNKECRYINSHFVDVDSVYPVRHGHWVNPTTIGLYSYDIPHCSACKGIPCGVDGNTKYCPNCGAKMDEEVSQ